MDEIEEEKYWCRNCSEHYDFYDWCDVGEVCRWCCEEQCCSAFLGDE